MSEPDGETKAIFTTTKKAIEPTNRHVKQDNVYSVL